jgi:hypothetical protein
MKKLATGAAVVALLGVSAAASAWWGGGPGVVVPVGGTAETIGGTTCSVMATGSST